MKHLCRTIVFCALLIITSLAYSQTSGNPGGYPSYTINQGATIVLHANADRASAYQWDKDGNEIAGAVKKDYTANSAGLYSVVALNNAGCPSNMSNAVRVIVNSVVKPDTAVDLQISIQSTNTHVQLGDSFDYLLTANNNSQINGTNVEVSYIIPSNLVYVPQITSNGTVTYDITTRKLTWSISTLAENVPTKLVITVKALTPGVVKSTVDIKGKELDPIMANNIDQTVQQVYPLVIPNIFTPNGDGVNDKFVIPGLETYSDTELTIMNRWGNTIYQKTNYQNDWDGQGMVEGTYFYVLKAKNKAGVWDVYKGYITLLRTRI
ncbi:gliding motility-associated C-terminal domain-containing protein [Mucilaginibacter sp.]|uniref:T9SS type B sorting domain-containing protein n=1 Tax=Mucilaginibacter sp. TaxID=1882438 RepID=UPI0026071D34|nr:gliding motility-associated C-terminal domain-containing protein [Mucilaginibacter sp.]MDB4925865.1 conserved repeat domain protein [Mucilaginibacter sp.]